MIDINLITDPRQKAILQMFGKDAYENNASITLSNKEEITAWMFDDNTTKEDLLSNPHFTPALIEQKYDEAKGF